MCINMYKYIYIERDIYRERDIYVCMFRDPLLVVEVHQVQKN